MNGLNAGLDPADATIASRSTALGQLVLGSGDLGLTDNTLYRLRAWLPNGSVTANRLNGPVPGYASLSLTGNRLVDIDHSVVAGVLTMSGNQFLDSGTGSQSLAKFVANRAALTGNVAANGNDAAVVTVVAPTMAAPGNLVSINRV